QNSHRSHGYKMIAYRAPNRITTASTNTQATAANNFSNSYPIACVAGRRAMAIARSNTRATEISVMQRWSMGQSRSMHGAQSGGSRIISAFVDSGYVVSGLVGPKMTNVGVPTAAP